MTLVQKALITLVVLALTFALGRRSVSQTSETKQTESQTHTDINTHTVTQTVTVKTPDGTVKTVTNTEITKDLDKTQNKQTETQIEPAKRSIYNVSLMTSIDVKQGIQQPDYGVSVSKEFIAPVTLGLFGLKSGILGLSIGLNF